MNVRAFDLNRVKALHFLLEEAHVGRAAAQLGITAAAASNALRRLREDFGDPLLVKRGRGLVRTRIADGLREPAREVIASAQALLESVRPFEARSFDGELPIALSEHVAAILLPFLDRLARERAPLAALMISPIPLDISDWLKRSGGVLVGPAGPLAATAGGDALITDDFYQERYVCVMRRGHPLSQKALTLKRYAEQGHVLVLPRGLSAKSEIDLLLEGKGLSRRVVRTVPSFQLAVPLLVESDLVTAMPERNARLLAGADVVTRDMPTGSPMLSMKLIRHPAHQQDCRTGFIMALLANAMASFDRDHAGGGSDARPTGL
jgi:DNA-binding transcriptional LysR family regulator